MIGVIWFGMFSTRLWLMVRCQIVAAVEVRRQVEAGFEVARHLERGRRRDGVFVPVPPLALVAELGAHLQKGRRGMSRPRTAGAAFTRPTMSRSIEKLIARICDISCSSSALRSGDWPGRCSDRSTSPSRSAGSSRWCGGTRRHGQRIELIRIRAHQLIVDRRRSCDDSLAVSPSDVIRSMCVRSLSS